MCEKESDSKDRSTMFVMGVCNISRRNFNNLVGNGSRSQDLSWVERINFLTSSAVAGLNDVIGKLTRIVHKSDTTAANAVCK